jgi:hypothetical protein
MAIIHRTVSPASEHTRASDHRRNIAITLVYDVRRGGEASPPAKGGGGSGGQPPWHPNKSRLLGVYAGFVAMSYA